MFEGSNSNSEDKNVPNSSVTDSILPTLRFEQLLANNHDGSAAYSQYFVGDSRSDKAGLSLLNDSLVAANDLISSLMTDSHQGRSTLGLIQDDFSGAQSSIYANRLLNDDVRFDSEAELKVMSAISDDSPAHFLPSSASRSGSSASIHVDDQLEQAAKSLQQLYVNPDLSLGAANSSSSALLSQYHAPFFSSSSNAGSSPVNPLLGVGSSSVVTTASTANPSVTTTHAPGLDPNASIFNASAVSTSNNNQNLSGVSPLPVFMNQSNAGAGSVGHSPMGVAVGGGVYGGMLTANNMNPPPALMHSGLLPPNMQFSSLQVQGMQQGDLQQQTQQHAPQQQASQQQAQQLQQQQVQQQQPPQPPQRPQQYFMQPPTIFMAPNGQPVFMRHPGQYGQDFAYPHQLDANGMPIPTIDPAQLQYAAQQKLAQQGYMQYPGMMSGAGMLPNYWAAAAAAAAAAATPNGQPQGAGGSNEAGAQSGMVFNPAAAAAAAAAAMGFPPMPNMHGSRGSASTNGMNAYNMNMMQMNMSPMGMNMPQSASGSAAGNPSMLPRMPAMAMADAAAVAAAAAASMPFGMVPDPATAAALMSLSRVGEHDPNAAAAAAAAAVMLMSGSSGSAGPQAGAPQHKPPVPHYQTQRDNRDFSSPGLHNGSGNNMVSSNNGTGSMGRGNHNNGNNSNRHGHVNNNTMHGRHVNNTHGHVNAGHNSNTVGHSHGNSNMNGPNAVAGLGNSNSYNNGSGHSVHSNAGNPQFRDSLVDEFRVTFGKSRQWNLNDLSQHIVAFCQDQHGSRFIQQKLEVCSDAEKQLVFDEILPSAHALMTDVFGNYVLQKLFEYGTPDQCEQLAVLLKGQAVQLSMQMYGCRVVQKALEYVNTARLMELVSEFEQPEMLIRCVHDSNGNHVIQKCIEVVSKAAKAKNDTNSSEYLSSRIQFIINAFQGQVKELSSHPYGCRVVQRILEHCTNAQKSVILEELRQCCAELVQDCYGNYVIQFVMQHGWDADRAVLIREVQSHLLDFSQHKFASNVVEKCLQYANKKDRDEMIWTIINVTFDLNNPVDAKGHCVLESMVRDPYANYVVQKVIDVADEGQRGAIMRYVKENINQLRKYTYGKHIIVRLEKITNEKF